MIAEAGGPKWYFGFNTGTHQARWAQRATRVGSIAEARRGDVIQWGGGAGGNLLHTAIVTAAGSNPSLIDSNWSSTNDELVRRGLFSSRNKAGSVYRIWRVGKVAEISEGSFVRAPDGRVYRIAGGAPIYISSWASFGRGQPVTDVSFERLNAMRPWPADGTFIHTNQDGAVYRVAGGAPIYVSTWATYGGPQPTVGIDKWAVDNLSRPAAHMRKHPATGTFLRTSQDGRVYRVAGAAPLYVTAWDVFGGVRPYVDVDRWAVANAGHPASHLLRLPRDGTIIRGLPSGNVWRIAAGKRQPSSAQSGFVDINDEIVLGFPLVNSNDETTPGSPLDAGPHVGGASPPAYGFKTLVRLKLAEQRTPAGGRLAVRLSNANSFAVTGTLSAETAKKIPVASRKRARRIKLRSSFSTLGPKASRTLALRLPSKLRRLLKRQGGLSLRLTASVSDPAGNTRTVKKRVSAKLESSRRRPAPPRSAGNAR